MLLRKAIILVRAAKGITVYIGSRARGMGNSTRQRRELLQVPFAGSKHSIPVVERPSCPSCGPNPPPPPIARSTFSLYS